MIDTDSRLRVARGIGKDETQASRAVFTTLRRRGHPDRPPPITSDGWGGNDNALLDVYGQVPPYSGRGRPPTKKQPAEDWMYLQWVKQRTPQGHVTGVDARVVFGEEERTRQKLPAHQAYIERTHLTMRQFNSRLARKTLAFSKAVPMYRAALAWDDAYYNWVRPHKSLRVPTLEEGPKQWEPCTPAMAAGLTRQVWSVHQLLMAIPTPKYGNS